jgi:hypothetical protein
MSQQPEKKPAPLKFEVIKEELQKAIQEKLKLSPIPNESGFALIEGFMSLPIRPEFSNDIFLGGPSLPLVGIVGSTSGRVYTFALKAILPNISI